MGLFSRFKSKDKKETETPAAPAEPVATYKVTFRCPQYFKAESGGWYVAFDGKQYTIEPLGSVSVELPEGKHTVSVTSYPEALGELSAEIRVDREMVLSVSVNMLNRTMKMFDYQHNVTICTK